VSIQLHINEFFLELSPVAQNRQSTCANFRLILAYFQKINTHKFSVPVTGCLLPVVPVNALQDWRFLFFLGKGNMVKKWLHSSVKTNQKFFFTDSKKVFFENFIPPDKNFQENILPSPGPEALLSGVFLPWGRGAA
jgi:hypothetical protein